ncbi:MAG: RluA family pseudouridine synthase, partial [Stellaceae bacterium]
MSGAQTIAVQEEEAELRLDRWFKRQFPEIGHGRLEKLLRTGQVRLDGRRTEAGERIASGQTVRVPQFAAVSQPIAAKQETPIRARDAAMLQRAVLYRDASVIVIN